MLRPTAGSATREQSVSDTSGIEPRLDLLSNLIALGLPVTKIDVYLIPVVEIVGDSSIHICKIQSRVLLRYFFRSRAIQKRDEYGIEGNACAAHTDDPVCIRGEWRRLS